MDETTIVTVGTEKVSAFMNTVMQYATSFGVKIVVAIVFWVVGRWLIGFAVGLVQKSLERQRVDPTVLRYVGSFITVTLNILLVVGILGYFGVQTTSLAALIAAVGLAIGMAWSGLLANLAAGGFIIVLRPFKVGDFISAGGVVGTVKEIGLFATAINTPDNVLTLVGNNKIFTDNIQNFTHNAYRRVDLKAQLSGAADHAAAVALLKARVAAIPTCWGAGGGGGDPRVQPGGPGAGGAPLLPQRPLLAGVLRHQPHHQGCPWLRLPAPMPAQTVIVQQG